MDFNEYWKNGCFGEYHDIYAKNLADKFYQAGQQSKQAEIDELQKRINDALSEIESGITGKHHVKRIVRILKGELK